MLRQVIGRIKTGSKKATGFPLNGLDLLRADHMRIEAVAIRLRLSRDPEAKKKLLDQLQSELGKHMRVEEEIFYPASARIQGLAELIDHAHTDHQLVKNVLKDLAVMDPSTGQFNSYVSKLVVKLEKHVHMEEDVIFPDVRKDLSRSEFMVLSRRIIDAHSRQGAVEREAAA